MIRSLPNLYSFLGLTKEQTNTLLNNIDQYYSRKRKPKMKYGSPQLDHGEIKYRDLIVPEYLLKSRQQRIAQLLNKISLPDYVFGSVKDKSNIKNALEHLNHKYFLTIDLKDFFTNINNKQVFKMLIENNFSADVSSVLTKSTTYKYSLPQGAPSSPVIANLVFLDTARKLKSIAERNDLIFTTFLDDLSFSGNHNFKQIVPDILQLLKTNGFFPSHKKIHFRKNYCEVTGLFVNGDKLDLPYKMANKAKTNIKLQAYQQYINQCHSV